MQISIMFGLHSLKPKNRGSIPEVDGDFLSAAFLQTLRIIHPNVESRAVDFFPRGKAVGAWSWPIAFV
jgi:hypothetical protein